MKWKVLLYKIGGLESLDKYIKLMAVASLVFCIIDIIYLNWFPYIVDIGCILFNSYGIYGWFKKEK